MDENPTFTVHAIRKLLEQGVPNLGYMYSRGYIC